MREVAEWLRRCAATAACGAASHQLAEGVVGVFADRTQGIQAQATITRGRAATAEQIAALAPCEMRVEAHLVRPTSWWGEVTRRTADDVETCVLCADLDGDGNVDRLLSFRCEVIPEGNAPLRSTAASGHDALQRYFSHLGADRFEEAVAVFTPDCIYSHPPYRGAPERVLFIGSAELLDGFRNVRGPSPVRNTITRLEQDGSVVFLEGVVDGIPNGGTFVSTARLSPPGLIQRYVAFYVSERLP